MTRRLLRALAVLALTSAATASPVLATWKALPGAPPISQALQAKLGAALSKRGPGYVARTHNKRPDGSPIYTNRLILETSPYLNQHAQTRSTGIRGAMRPSKRPESSADRYWSASATRHAIGVT